MVDVEGVIDVYYASLTSQEVQHRVFYPDGHPSRYQPRPTGLNFGEQTGTGVFLFLIAVLLIITANKKIPTIIFQQVIQKSHPWNSVR